MNPEIMKALEQMQKMQEEVAKTEQSLGAVTTTAEAGGGMVKVTVNGHGEITAVKLEKEVVNPDDQEMLEDLIVAAANRALKKSKDIVSEKMEKISKDFMPDIPGLLK
jgi:DNA-binding YbaB/EbfC family protein